MYFNTSKDLVSCIQFHTQCHKQTDMNSQAPTTNYNAGLHHFHSSKQYT